VQTFSGDFESSFPIVEERARDGRRDMYFTFGDGRAALEFESFQGRIRLLQEGSAKARDAMQYRARAMREMQRQLERLRLQAEREIELDRAREARRSR
jgi:hypothetical protein